MCAVLFAEESEAEEPPPPGMEENDEPPPPGIDVEMSDQLSCRNQTKLIRECLQEAAC